MRPWSNIERQRYSCKLWEVYIVGTVSGASKTVNPAGEEAAAVLRSCYEVLLQSNRGLQYSMFHRPDSVVRTNLHYQLFLYGTYVF